MVDLIRNMGMALMHLLWRRQKALFWQASKKIELRIFPFFDDFCQMLSDYLSYQIISDYLRLSQIISDYLRFTFFSQFLLLVIPSGKLT